MNNLTLRLSSSTASTATLTQLGDLTASRLGARGLLTPSRRFVSGLSNTVSDQVGGLVAKEMVRTARETADEYRGLAERIVGFVFLGTPNNGSAIAQYISALKVIPRGGKSP